MSVDGACATPHYLGRPHDFRNVQPGHHTPGHHMSPARVSQRQPTQYSVSDRMLAALDNSALQSGFLDSDEFLIIRDGSQDLQTVLKR